jgi:hypothetical protein
MLLALVAVSVSAQSPAGWKVRADKSTNAADPDGAGDIKFMTMGDGFHAVNPQAAVYWNPKNTASGAYTLKGTFTLNKPSSHPNYYGLIFGGSKLEGAEQNYTYFVVAQNGMFLVKRRVGDAKTEDVVPRTAHDAIKKPDASGKSVNALEVRVMADKVDYVVNGTVVHSTPNAGMTTDGIWGIRVNHQLDVNINALSASTPSSSR